MYLVAYTVCYPSRLYYTYYTLLCLVAYTMPSTPYYYLVAYAVPRHDVYAAKNTPTGWLRDPI